MAPFIGPVLLFIVVGWAAVPDPSLHASLQGSLHCAVWVVPDPWRPHGLSASFDVLGPWCSYKALSLLDARSLESKVVIINICNKLKLFATEQV